MNRLLILLLIAAIAFAGVPACSNSSELKAEFSGQWDTLRVLENPGKGWYHHLHDNGVYRYDISNDSLFDAFPGMDHIYIRIAWSFLEPKEGVFDWHLIDEVVEEYVPRGYGIAFRVSCKERRGYPTSVGQLVDGVHYATPYWVREAGCKGHLSVGRGTDALSWSPDWDDPVYLEKLDNFHRAFAERYGKEPWVRFIEVGSIGDYGEGHTNASTKLTPDVNEVRTNLDVYIRNYKHAQLLTSDDLLYWHKSDEEVQGLLDYAVANGFTISDESPMVPWYIETFLDTWSVSHPHFFEAVYRDRPTKLELQHYSGVKRKHWRGRNGEEVLPDYGVSGADIFRGAIRTMHATYIGYHGFAEEFLTDNPELAAEFANLCGYWFFPVSAQVPAPLAESGNVLSMEWMNRGVAPAYVNYELVLRLEGRKGMHDLHLASGCKDWMPDEVVAENYAFDLPTDIKRGTYILKFKLVDTSLYGRTVLVGVDEVLEDDDNFVSIGKVTVR